MIDLITYGFGGVASRNSVDYSALALVGTNVLFTQEVFCNINPFFFPGLLSEVLEFETWMKD